MRKETKTIFGAAMILGALSFASRLVGFVRVRVLSGEFGAGDILDVYNAAFKLPDFLFGLIVVGALSASFIPLFTRAYTASGSHARAWEFTNNVLHLIGGAMIVLSIILAFLARPLAEVIAPGFSPEKQIMVAEFLRVLLLAQIFLAGSVVFGSVLQSLKRFALYALAPIFYNFGIIAGALWIVPSIGPIGLAWGVVLGAALHFFLQFFGALASGYRYKPVWHVRDKDSQEMFLLMGPRMLGIGVSHVQLLMFASLASFLPSGNLTMFQIAYDIQFFPVGIIGVSYAIAAFPNFTEALIKDDRKEFVRVFSGTVRQILFFLVPLTLAFLVFRAQAVRLVAGAGAFDWAATIETANILACFSLSFVAQSLVYVLSRAFFALKDTATPLVAGVVATVFAFVTAMWLVPMLGASGLAVAFSLAATINLALLWVPLRQRIGTLDEARLVRSLAIFSVAGMVSGVTMQFLKPLSLQLVPLDTFAGVFLQASLAGGAGLVVYVAICALLRSEELQGVRDALAKKALQRAKPVEMIPPESTVGT